MGRRRSRALALALVVWFVAIVLFDVAALGLTSLLRSGPASRVLIVSVLVNPADAVRIGALLGLQGTTAFGWARPLADGTGGPDRRPSSGRACTKTRMPETETSFRPSRS